MIQTEVRVLREADFRRWYLSQSVSYAGTAASAVALPLLAYRTTGSATVTAAVAAFVAYAGSVCALAAVGRYWAALLLWTGWSFANTLAITNAITVRQQLTPDDLQGRVNTTGRMIAWGGTPFGAVLAGVAADTFGVATAYLLLVAPVLAGLVVLLRSPVRTLRTARA